MRLLPQDVLLVVATAGEAEFFGGLGCRVVVSGVGPVAAALATAQATAARRPRLAVSAGIAGAFAPSGLRPGDLALSSRMIQADYGAELGSGPGAAFLDLPALELTVGSLPGQAAYGDFAAAGGTQALAQQLGAGYGPMLTLNTVTGSRERAEELLRRFPGALTEGMEGAGVAHAAALAGVPALELRGISNFVGPRDRSAWQIGAALQAARRGLGGLLAADWPEE
ncbi:futalosine nucleosidase [Deinococcus proteolyticus MRP]|uniref:Futalosine hydrolase n=1 Tax=Deinococcus proteolyticus (strain ATCC 35074 / DSM 20540 / JCM 6276 / NBRC 101906 / NCIMB 13154 / VKM Ac-1939 / CCM 2703 / MRP) TaxID=693977 RepID=F0RL03_DEIPM|nr:MULTISPECIES: futalosine hydrolase [Deinococcus]ADY25776.1 futalosine nucleosidase [Deinococcus proteolyticus MRP]MCY1701900.1 futalosine hydrolase [Deinococcus sp. SL84]